MLVHVGFLLFEGKRVTTCPALEHRFKTPGTIGGDELTLTTASDPALRLKPKYPEYLMS